jgi:iron complex outermembrane receptor protein
MDNSGFDSVSFDYYGFADARRVLTTPSIRYHNVSARWSGDDMAVTVGIRNLTDEDPPMISDGQAFRTGNIPAYGTQYDLLGRSAFMSLTRQF